MQDIDDIQKALSDSGVLSPDEAIALMRVLAGEPITSKMLNSLPAAIGKIVPNIIQKLVEEYLKLLDQVKDLEKKAKISNELTEKEKEIYLKLVSEEKLDAKELATLPAQTRNLVKTYNATINENKELRKDLEQIQKDIEKVTNYVKSVRAEDEDLDQYEVADEVLPLANAVVNLADTSTERVKNQLVLSIEDGLETGTYKGVSAEVIESINKLVIRRLEEILKPYEDLSRGYVAGEITHEEFTEALKRNALVNHMREQVVSDLVKALEEGRIDAPEIPPRLRTAIQGLLQGNKWQKSKNPPEKMVETPRPDTEPPPEMIPPTGESTGTIF